MKNVFSILEKYFFNDGFTSAGAHFLVEGAAFSLLLTKWGLCLNFNLQPMESMLHVDKYMIDQFQIGA